MREQDLLRQARMKRTGFGVEIEMNHIHREKAARIAAGVYWPETERSGEDGLSGAAGNIARQMEDPVFQGNTWGSWEFYDPRGRTWTVKKDASIHGPDEQKCELITPILTYDPDMPVLQEMVRRLRRAGARSAPSEGCGVHIHISGEGHTAHTLLNLVNLMASHEDQLIRAIGISRERQRRYCKTVDPAFLERIRQRKPCTMEQLQVCWYNGPPAQARYSPTRYHMLNLHSFFTRYHTIEFRLFQFDERSQERRGGLHAGQLRSMVLLCLAMNDMALNQKKVRLKVQQTENEAYALRCFLLRLGFIGEEFKSARQYFLRNAQGNSAWR